MSVDSRIAARRAMAALGRMIGENRRFVELTMLNHLLENAMVEAENQCRPGVIENVRPFDQRN